MKRIAAVVLGGLALVLLPPSAGAVSPRASRVLIVSFPALSYAQVAPDTMPNLDAFLDQAAIGGLATRVEHDHPTIADTYATLGAGTRTRGAGTDAGWVFDADEPFGSGTAGEEYTRRTGRPSGSGLVYLAQPALARVNRNLSYGTEVGALGDALARAGHGRAAIANADKVQAQRGVQYERTAATMLTGSDGRAPAGAVSASLLQPDAGAPYGVQLDIGAVVDGFAANWKPGGVVLVEASDLSRAAAASVDSTDTAALMQHARARSDALLGALLARVDLARDVVMVLGPHPDGPGSPLGIAALRGPGVNPGLLSSGSTRRTGFVQLTDVAPTVLDRLGVVTPASMEGRPFVIHPGHGSAHARRVGLVDANRAAQYRDHVIGPVAAVWCSLVALWGAFAIAVFTLGRLRGARPVLAPVAVALLAVPIPLWLAGPVDFAALGSAWFTAWILCGTALVTLLAYGLGRRNRLDPLLGVLGGIITLVGIDLVSGAHLQLNTVLGYSVNVAGRFAGIGNLAYAVFGAAGLCFTGLLAHRRGGRRGRVTAAVVLLVVCALDGLPFFGSDVGGMLSLIPASVVMLWLLWGKRVRLRTVVLTTAITIGVVFVAGCIDLARPADRRTHLGRLFERVGSQGWDGLWTVLRRKGEANLGIIALSPWTLLIPLVFVLVGSFFVRRSGPMRDVLRNVPELVPTYIGLAVLSVLGWFLNDSGIVIPGLMLTIAVAVLVYVAARMEDPDDTLVDLPAVEEARV